MHYVGLDIHQRSTSVEILDQHGKFFKRFEIKEPWPKLASRVAEQTPAPFAICCARLEVGGDLLSTSNLPCQIGGCRCFICLTRVAQRLAWMNQE